MNFRRLAFVSSIFLLTSGLYALTGNKYVSEYFYEMWRFEICGNVNPDYVNSHEIKSFPLLNKSALFYNTTFWTFEHGAIRLSDFLMDEYIGLIENSRVKEPLSDDGSWLKALLRGSPNDFVITRPEELDENQLAVHELSQKIEESGEADYYDELSEKTGSEEKRENYENNSQRSLKNKDNELVYYTFGDEFFSVQNIPESRVVVRGDKDNLFRLFYDSNLRVEKKEIWKYTKDIKTSAVASSQTFRYNGDSSIPAFSELKESDKKTELSYDEKGRICESKIYSIQQKTELLTSKTTWKFNSSGKVVEKLSENYNYRKGKVKSLLSTESKKEVYMYKVDEKTPDYYYYENNELRMKTKYSSTDNYVTTTYFDGGFVVENYFEADQRKKDIFYLNGIVKRIKSYEQ